MLLATIDNHAVTELRELFQNNKKNVDNILFETNVHFSPIEAYFLHRYFFFVYTLHIVHIDVVALRKN